MSFLVHVLCTVYRSFFFFFNDTATTEIYTLSLHDALPISRSADAPLRHRAGSARPKILHRLEAQRGRDRKSTRLNSSHGYISYAVFCLKKKKELSLADRFEEVVKRVDASDDTKSRASGLEA